MGNQNGKFFYPINQVTLNLNSIQNTVHKFTDPLKELYLSMQEHLLLRETQKNQGLNLK
jgi:hypothetical protein